MELERLLVSPHNSIREVVECIERNAKGIALVVDQAGRLAGTVTDGDIRRSILAGVDQDQPVQVLLDQRSSTPYPRPITAPVDTPAAELLELMNKHSIRHVPIVDTGGVLVDVALLSELAKEYELPMTAVIMAGGLGTRLRPLTDELPKPMLPVGGGPLLERTIRQLRDAGIRRLSLTTHYKKDIIAQHFGDGHNFGVEISYIEEEDPMGTAGAIGLLGIPDEPLLVINGDILTQVDFRSMLDFHKEQQAEMTVAVREHEFQFLYGVVEIDGVEITGITEKPTIKRLINAGIYLLNPGACNYIPSGQQFDMTDLISRLVAEGHRVAGFPIHEYWLDIGQVEDYQRAISDIRKGQA